MPQVTTIPRLFEDSRRWRHLLAPWCDSAARAEFLAVFLAVSQKSWVQSWLNHAAYSGQFQ